ncbi:hypothetical protein H2201_000704 [Coniosporium apollinis]|uniref:Transcription initiation factor IIF subunit beta n=1 Tax=Coniosporium apollinis TaxID=61459 RepID=A0ABQ9PAF5_9PEZI|nr:hypothetical protein H2201_000704 [Coniosporium apollinis]
MAANVTNGVKTEDGEYIKLDPDSSSPAPMLDDIDVYEDTGELSIPQHLTRNGWLARLPEELWDVLEKLKDDEPVQIGTLAVWQVDGEQKSRLMLSPTLSMPANLEREYEMRLTNAASRNTYVFSEKDQADFKAGVYRRGPKPGYQRNQDSSNRVDKKRHGRTIIPKFTALTSAIHHELAAIPIRDPSKAPVPPRARAQRMEIHDLRDEKAIKQSVARRADAFENIAQASKIRKRRPQDNKAVRIGETELINMIFDAFKEFQYWSLKALRDRTKQPESYLKETLDQIAVMVRGGAFTNLWMLKPENRDSVYGNMEPPKEAAPEAEGVGTDQEGEGEFEDDVDLGDDDEMVDVLPA